MVRIWISRHSTIPVRDQLGAQLRFGILSGRLAPSERLPSVRDLARRLKIHPNTVSAAYQDLAATGWVTAKSGSGVFVHDIKRDDASDGIESLVHAWIEEGRSRGFALDALRAEFEKASRALSPQGAPRSLSVVHSDLYFARILAAEIQEAIGSTVNAALPQDSVDSDCLVLTTASGAAAISHLRPERQMVIPLKTIEQVLDGVRRPSSPFLIGIVSSSESILKWASLLIAALGTSGNDVIQRNPQQPKWKDGLAACDLVVADLLSVPALPKNIQPVVLRLIPDAFLQRVRELVTVEKA